MPEVQAKLTEPKRVQLLWDVCRIPDFRSSSGQEHTTLLARIFEFLGVTPDHPIGDFRATDHHIIGNRMRLSRTSEIRIDERWRAELLPEQIRTVERIAGPELKRYGYAMA